MIKERREKDGKTKNRKKDWGDIDKH